MKTAILCLSLVAICSTAQAGSPVLAIQQNYNRVTVDFYPENQLPAMYFTMAFIRASTPYWYDASVMHQQVYFMRRGNRTVVRVVLLLRYKRKQFNRRG